MILAAPLLAGSWILSRKPVTSAAVAVNLFTLLESGNPKDISRFLLPAEQKALGISQAQIEQILIEVIAPAYRSLSVRPKETFYRAGSYEKFFTAPCRVGKVNAYFTLGLYELSPGEFHTSLTYLYTGIILAELEVGKRSGTEKDVEKVQRDRIAKLKTLGMRGRYDFNEDRVIEWSH